MDFKDAHITITDFGNDHRVEIKLLFSDGTGSVDVEFIDQKNDEEGPEDQHFRLVAKAKKIITEAAAAL